MTAIGFIIAIIGFIFASFAEANFSRSLSTVGGWFIFVGGMFMLAGTSVKLWEIMP
jgi:hypothetical protein